MQATNFKDEPVNITRITLHNSDGTVQTFEVSERFHFLLGFATCGPRGGKNVQLEAIVKGSEIVISEIYSKIGERHPCLVTHATRKTIERTIERAKARGIDLLGDAFKNARPVGGVQ